MRIADPRASVQLYFRVRLPLLILSMAIASCVSSAASPLNAQARSVVGSGDQPVTLDRRMSDFLRYVRRRDDDSIAMAFPNRGEVEYRRTLHEHGGKRTSVWRFPAAEVPQALTRGPLRESFTLDPHSQPIGRFMHQAILRPGRWRPVAGNRFVPPGAPATSLLFVQWRRENEQWVISAFGDEGYGDGAAVPAWCC